jgi:hypothetical protein
MVGELSGRRHEIGSVEQFLHRAALTPELLVLVGEPGIGKTALWRAGVQRARACGTRVLEHRAVEAEATLAFAGVADLLAGVADEVLPSLGDLRRRALEAALLLDGPKPRTTAEPRAIGLAVLDVLKVLAAEAPLLLAVDDFQWLDTASARTLLFAIRRLHDEPVATLLTARPRARELERGLASDTAGRLVVGPLDVASLFGVLKTHLGLDLSPRAATRSTRYRSRASSRCGRLRPVSRCGSRAICGSWSEDGWPDYPPRAAKLPCSPRHWRARRSRR